MTHSRFPLSSSLASHIRQLQRMAGTQTEKSVGMGQGSTEIEQLADWLSRRDWSELLTDHCLVEQRYSLDGKATSLRLQSSIVDLTFKDESGTLLEELVRL